MMGGEDIPSNLSDSFLQNKTKPEKSEEGINGPIPLEDLEPISTAKTVGLTSGENEDLREQANAETFIQEKNFVDLWLKDAPHFCERYKILEKLGEGAMGEVYKALDKELNRTVALKFPIFKDLRNSSELQRFMQEAKNTAQLKHPNIVTIYDIILEKNQPFLVMEFINGISLKKFIQETEQISHEQACEIMIKISQAVHYAHEQNIVHRDLKPDNVMMENEKNPKVMDFGLARMQNADVNISQTGMIIGTPKYMSPEQALGNIKLADGRSDIFSLGVIFYEILTGEVPFTAETFMNLIYKIVNEDPIRPSSLKKDIPLELETICLKALSKKKEDRYQSAEEFAQELLRFSKGEEIHTKRRKGYKWVKRIAIVVLALIVGWLASSYTKGKKTEAKKNQNTTKLLKKKVDLKKVILQFQILKTENHIKKKKTYHELLEISEQIIPQLIENLGTKNEHLRWYSIKTFGIYK